MIEEKILGTSRSPPSLFFETLQLEVDAAAFFGLEVEIIAFILIKQERRVNLFLKKDENYYQKANLLNENTSCG